MPQFKEEMTETTGGDGIGKCFLKKTISEVKVIFKNSKKGASPAEYRGQDCKKKQGVGNERKIQVTSMEIEGCEVTYVHEFL